MVLEESCHVYETPGAQGTGASEGGGKKAADELERKRKASKRDMPDIIEQLDVLFQAKTSQALRMGFEENAAPEEIATGLDVPTGHVEYLFDVAGDVSRDLLRMLQRWPSFFDNRSVLENALQSMRNEAYREVFRFYCSDGGERLDRA